MRMLDLHWAHNKTYQAKGWKPSQQGAYKGRMYTKTIITFCLEYLQSKCYILSRRINSPKIGSRVMNFYVSADGATQAIGEKHNLSAIQ